MIKKLGLDIHGVLDKNPDDFVKIAKDVQHHGGHVYIITGSSYDHAIEQQLLSYNNGNKFWNFFISIEDELTKRTPYVKIDIYGRPNWLPERWDSFKGLFCAKHNIDVHYDDTFEYAKYFTTPIIIYVNEKKRITI